MRAAWFKDPDGNIFSIVTQPKNRVDKRLALRAARPPGLV